MVVEYFKYQALLNDFLVIEAGARRMLENRLSTLAQKICDRRSGIGADGILYVGGSRMGERRIDVYNADGSWAEKSGNGLRIVGLHEFLKQKTRRTFTFEMGGVAGEVRIVREQGDSYLIATDLGVPVFETEKVPVKSDQKFMIQAPLKLGRNNFPVTCLAVGNPHTVLFVDDFDFDWETLGEDIEFHKSFPQRTNVEFVRIRNRKQVEVAEWERGAGATGSSGTGAAAAVAAGVMSGALDRECEVVFAPGSIFVTWHDDTGVIEITGPVSYVGRGSIEFS